MSAVVKKNARVINYIWLIIIYVASHLLICMISGQWWDDWCYWGGGIEHLKKAYFESGMPLQAYNIMSVMWLPNWGYRIVVFLLYLAVGLLFYEILHNLKIIYEEDAFFIAAIAMTIPVNDARTILNCFGYAVEITLFMIAFFLVIRMMNNNGKRKVFLRIVSLIMLTYSYTMESLLVFTGLIWIYLFYSIWINNIDKRFISNIILFIREYLDYCILPFVFFVLKRL